jgi:hypothetical protein
LEKAWSTISRIYGMVRILSLDILAGVFCGYHFARLTLDCNCPSLTPLILCLTVWLIYTLDHMLDARDQKENSIKPVYRWHWDQRYALRPLWLLVGLVTIGLSLAYLPGKILLFGGITASLVVIYTIAHQGKPGTHRKYLFKEVWISILYTAGIWGVPLISKGSIHDISVLLTIVIYLVLVLVNVLLYSLYDYNKDRKESQHTLATRFGREATCHLLRLLIISALILILAAFLISDEQAMMKFYIILLSMTAVLGVILIFPRFFGRHERFGMLADGAFLLPGLLVLIW